jgi:dihydroflavonol-4-reductase
MSKTHGFFVYFAVQSGTVHSHTVHSLIMNILITGATGFVGSYLTRYLVQQGQTNIIAIKRKSSRMELVQPVVDRVTWAEGDILDVPFLEKLFTENKITHIYHCAAVVSFDPKEREMMYAANGIGTENIVNMALDFGAEKLIHVSSIAAVGRVKNENHVSENNKWQRSPLNSHYAISKFQAEQEVWRGIAEGLTAAIVNPSVIIGSQYWQHGTGKMFDLVWNGLPYYTQGVTGYVDVRDVVRYMVELMQSPIDNQRFILNAENITYQDFFAQIARILDKKPAHILVTPFIREVVWRMAWLKSKIFGGKPFLTKESARASMTTFYYNNEKSLKALPHFQYRQLSHTIRETTLQFKESVQKGVDYAYLNFE